MATEIYSYIGSGKVYMQDLVTDKGLIWIGLVDELTLKVDVDKKELADHSSPGGGIADSVTRIKSMGAEMKVRSLSPSNIALALMGTTSAIAAGTVTDEAHKAYKGALLKFGNLPDTTQAIVVTSAGGTPTYVKDVDYEVTPSGVRILEAGNIVDGADLLVDYSKVAANAIEVLTNTGRPFRLVFEGLNEARTGKATVVELHRTKPTPSSVPLINDDFAELSLPLDVLLDLTKTGAGISRYARIQAAA